jgi:protocatechuate 3,4-dioxygenase beta subunit
MTTEITDAALDALVDRIRQLIYDCGPTANRHDLAVVAIEACIAEGADTKADLMRVLVRAGFKAGHVAMVLDPRKGPFASAEHWQADADGRYRLRERGPA